MFLFKHGFRFPCAFLWACGMDNTIIFNSTINNCRAQLAVSSWQWLESSWLQDKGDFGLCLVQSLVQMQWLRAIQVASNKERFSGISSVEILPSYVSNPAAWPGILPLASTSQAWQKCKREGKVSAFLFKTAVWGPLLREEGEHWLFTSLVTGSLHRHKF